MAKQILTWNQEKMQYSVRFATPEETNKIKEAVSLIASARQNYYRILSPTEEELKLPSHVWGKIFLNMDGCARKAVRVSQGLANFDVRKYLAPWNS
jgi:hypothetical protein